MEKEQQKGAGKENQLSKIAAAINPGSVAEANPTSTQSMISTFVKYFESSALEIVQEMDNDQEELIKNMVDEITKLQTKNMQEFEKAIGKIVGISNKMMESNNPKMQELGKGMQDQAKNELLKSSGFNLQGENDTFKNRLKRELSGEGFDPSAPKEKTTGLGKIKGFWSDTKNEFKKGAMSAIQEGSFADKVVRSDEEKRQRLLNRVEETATETNTQSLTDVFKKVIEETLTQGKAEANKKPEKKQFQPIEKLTDLSDQQKKALEEQGIAPTSENDISFRKDGKPVSIEDINKALSSKTATQLSSEGQEDTAGISKDAQIEALQKTAESNIVIQENSSESVDILGKLLEEVKKITEIMITNGNQAGMGDGGFGGGSLGLDALDLLDGGSKKGSRGGAKGGGKTPGKLGRLGRIGKALGGVGRGALGLASKAAVPLTIAYGAYDAYTGYQDAAETEKTQNTEIDKKVASGEITKEQAAKAKSETKKKGRVEKSKAIGGGVGMAGGALAGAALGATVGSVVPGLGTVVGGAVGGVVGGIAGSGAGKWLGEKAGNAINWFKGDEQPTQAKGKVSGKAAPQTKQEGFFTRNKGMLMGAALGPAGMAAGALYDSSKKTGNTETGKNVDGALIEAGTAATKDKMQVNVPPPTIINQGGGGGGQSAPTITAPGGVGSVRSDDPTWLMFQKRRAVA